MSETRQVVAPAGDTVTADTLRPCTEVLRGRFALVTGARVKIGHHAPRLLRCGATVVAATRFPHDAARRYASRGPGRRAVSEAALPHFRTSTQSSQKPGSPGRIPFRP